MRAAIYARFSSDKQRDASIEDQQRKCEERTEAEGWKIVERYADRAMSGSRADNRPGYQRMLQGAMAGEFDVLIVEGLDRLSRDSVNSEQTIRRLEFKGIRIVGVADGYDSTSGKGKKLLRGVRGLLNEAYLDDLREKTHRGLEGAALKGNAVGSSPYGYKHVAVDDPVRRDALGRPVVIAVKREVDPAKADVVRRIFAWYAEGKAPRAIAEALNSEGVPSPGANWNRRGGRCKGWSWTAIAGPMAETGILNNEIYIGRCFWNRSQWSKDPDTGKRHRVVNPRNEWVITESPELRIVDQELWNKVKTRQQERAQVVGARFRAGVRVNARNRAGAPGRYLFSTLLKCGVCGSSYTMNGKTDYACAARSNGRKHYCNNTLTVKRALVERVLLADIKERLLSPAAITEVVRRTKLLTQVAEAAPKPDGSRSGMLRAEIANLSDAIASGVLRTSPTIAERLQRAEAELARIEAKAAEPSAKVTRMLPRIAEQYRAMVDDFANVETKDVARARIEIRRLLGDEIRVRPSEDGTHLEAAVPEFPDKLIELAVGNGRKINELENMVAGIGFEPMTFGL